MPAPWLVAEIPVLDRHTSEPHLHLDHLYVATARHYRPATEPEHHVRWFTPAGLAGAPGISEDSRLLAAQLLALAAAQSGPQFDWAAGQNHGTAAGLQAALVPFAWAADVRRGLQSPGQHTFAELLAATGSVIRFEMRDSYDQTEQGFADWQATGDTSTYDWGDHLDIARTAVARGVTFRRVRVISEPLSAYIRWEHASTGTNTQAGEDIRWLPRTSAADPLLPGADCFVSDALRHPLELPERRRNQPRHYTFSSDPRTIRDSTAAFEIAGTAPHPTPNTKPARAHPLMPQRHQPRQRRCALTSAPS